MGRVRSVLVAGAVAVAVSAVAVGPAVAAKGGNNDTAKVCQKGGWKTLVPDAGGTFANQGDCVNDGARGSAPFGTAGNAECNEIGGAFELRAANRWNLPVRVQPPKHVRDGDRVCYRRRDLQHGRGVRWERGRDLHRVATALAPARHSRADPQPPRRRPLPHKHREFSSTPGHEGRTARC
jgi:hypothetical protein